MTPDVLKGIETTGATLGVLGALLVTSQSSQTRTVAFLFWIVANVLLAVLFLDKGLNALALMQTIYLVLALWGFATNLTAWRHNKDDQ